MFDFLKYTTPLWYYRLQYKAETPMFSDTELEQLQRTGVISPYFGYYERESTRMDMVFQALQSGAIPNDPASGSNTLKPDVAGIHDNYLFLRRHFPWKWSVYTLMVRLAGLHNPFKEIGAFFSARGAEKAVIRRGEMYEDRFSHTLSDRYREALVSIIIPTLNRYDYLKDVLDDLDCQDHGKIEVIVCDQSDPFDGSLYENRRFPIKVIRQQEKALWKARNSCFKACKGRYILLFDDDSRVAKDWVSQHLLCLSYFNSKISAGVTETVVGNVLSQKDSIFHMSDVFDTGNAMVCRTVFEKIGLFDRQFEKQRMGDGEFGLRAYIAGFKVISNPLARRVHLKADTGGLRHFGGWDAFRPGKIFAPRPIPSVLYFSRRYFGTRSSILLLLNSMPSSIIPYRLKNDSKLKWMALLISPLLVPLLVAQAAASWRLSSKMLVAGPMIESADDIHKDVTASSRIQCEGIVRHHAEHNGSTESNISRDEFI